ncbi:hypothetical protein EsHS_00006727 [Epichloe bromicola]
MQSYNSNILLTALLPASLSLTAENWRRLWKKSTSPEGLIAGEPECSKTPLKMDERDHQSKRRQLQQHHGASMAICLRAGGDLCVEPRCGLGGHVHEPTVFPSFTSPSDDLWSELPEAVLEKFAILFGGLYLVRNEDNETTMSWSTMTTRLSPRQKSIPAQNLRALEPEDAEEPLTKIYVSVAETFEEIDDTS